MSPEQSGDFLKGVVFLSIISDALSTLGNGVGYFVDQFSPGSGANVNQSIQVNGQRSLGDVARPENSALSSALSSGFSDLAKAISSSFQASASSARDAEIAAADRANAFSREMWEKTARFNADQADLAWQRSETAAQKANDFTRSERLASQQWYENMSNTSYQRAVADMRAAGINPILAYAQGGASSAMSSAGSGALASAPSASASSSSGQKANASGAKSADQTMAVGVLQAMSGLANSTISMASSALKVLTML